jgi:hypothetical protein
MGVDIQAVGGLTAVEPRGAPSGSGGKPADGKLPDTKQPPRADASSSAAAEPAPAPDSVGLVFEVKPHSHEIVVKVVDRSTHKVIREIPPEEFQQMRSVMDDLVGMFVDHTG